MVTNTTPPIVEAVGLTKVFKDFWMRTKARAVDHVDFGDPVIDAQRREVGDKAPKPLKVDRNLRVEMSLDPDGVDPQASA